MKRSVVCRDRLDRRGCGYSNTLEFDEDGELDSDPFCVSCGLELEIPEPEEALSSESEEALSPEPEEGLSSEPKGARRTWDYSGDVAADGLRPFRSCPAVDSEGRLFACFGNQVVAFKIEDDEPRSLWKHITGGLIPGPPTIGEDGNIRVHSCDGHLHCLGPDGSPCWDPVRVGEPLGWAAPTTDLECNTWVSAFSGGLIKIDPSGQTEKRPFFRSTAKLDSTAFISDGILYIGSENHFLYAVDLSSPRGTSRWDQATNQGRTGWFINSSPVLLSENTVVVASRDDHLYGFNRDGEPEWNLKLPGQMLSSPVADAKGRIYVGLGHTKSKTAPYGSLVCIDGRSQKLLWSHRTAGPVESVPVIGSDGVVYVGDNSGTIYAVDETGQESWREEVGVPVRSAGTIVDDQCLVFGAENGSLIALKCTSSGLAQGWPKYMRTLTQSGFMLTSN